MAHGGLHLPGGAHAGSTPEAEYDATKADTEFRQGRALAESALAGIHSSAAAITELENYTGASAYDRLLRAGQLHGGLYANSQFYTLHPDFDTAHAEPFEQTGAWYEAVADAVIHAASGTADFGSIDQNTGKLSEKQRYLLAAAVAVFRATGKNATRDILKNATLDLEKADGGSGDKAGNHRKTWRIVAAIGGGLVSGYLGGKGVSVGLTGLLGTGGGLGLESNFIARDIRRATDESAVEAQKEVVGRRNAGIQRLIELRNEPRLSVVKEADTAAGRLQYKLSTGLSVHAALVEVLRESEAEAEPAEAADVAASADRWKLIRGLLGKRALSLIMAAGAGLMTGSLGNAVLGSTVFEGDNRPVPKVDTTPVVTPDTSVKAGNAEDCEALGYKTGDTATINGQLTRCP
jgi:hypothetical protein